MYCYHNVFSLFFFFFKQKTVYEMRISDWSSDVCSSDLRGVSGHAQSVGGYCLHRAGSACSPWWRERNMSRVFVSQFCSSKLAVLGLILLVVCLLMAIFAPWIAPQNPFDIATLDIFDSKMPPGSTNMDGSLTYWLGKIGRASGRESVGKDG